MANPEHLELLKQGIKKWSEWRKDHFEIRPDLSGADLSGADLSNADLSGADLSGADLREAKLREANLIQADLREVDLSWADLREAKLREANLSNADLSGADLSGADFSRTDLSGAGVGWTTFGNNVLSSVRGLDTVEHMGPSTIGIDTLYKSGGKIPESFLLGCGVPEQFITFSPSLTRVILPFQYYSCFVSYSTKDEDFAKRLHSRLSDAKVPVWFAREHIMVLPIVKTKNRQN